MQHHKETYLHLKKNRIMTRLFAIVLLAFCMIFPANMAHAEEILLLAYE